MYAKDTFELIQQYFVDKPVKKVQAFGSFARNENKNSSDIDLLITMEHPVGLLKLAGYQADLQHILNKKVDLITEPSIPDSFRNIIKQDLTVVYERN